MMGLHLLRRVLKRIDVDHPAEKLRPETTAGLVAFLLCSNCTTRAKARPIYRLGISSTWRETEIDVSMLARNAQWDVLIEALL